MNHKSAIDLTQGSIPRILIRLADPHYRGDGPLYPLFDGGPLLCGPARAGRGRRGLHLRQRFFS